jgi:hypothetical protein
MRRKEFSFACPTLVNDKNEVLEFQRFLKVPKTDSDKIHNAFPQTAYADNYNQACTHPLLYLWYRPTIDDRQIENIRRRLLTAYYNLLTYSHEFKHIALAETPAKIYARQVLAWAYTFVNALLNEERWNEEIWWKLEIANEQLAEICEAITLSEELLAIATSVEDVTKALAASIEDVTKGSREKNEALMEVTQIAMETLEKESINTYQNLSPDFADLYYNTFKKVATWKDYKDLLLPPVACYLQGIQKLRPAFELTNSYIRCKNLAEKVKNIKNEAGLAD